MKEHTASFCSYIPHFVHRNDLLSIDRACCRNWPPCVHGSGLFVTGAVFAFVDRPHRDCDLVLLERSLSFKRGPPSTFLPFPLFSVLASFFNEFHLAARCCSSFLPPKERIEYPDKYRSARWEAPAYNSHIGLNGGENEYPYTFPEFIICLEPNKKVPYADHSCS